MNNNQKLILFLFGIFICLLMFFSVQIYAKYLTSVSANTGINIANWNISVNEKSIKDSSDISSVIVPVFTGNEHISPGVIAPTAEGYFDLNLDFTGINVSFAYEIEVSSAEGSSIPDLVSTGFSIDDGEKINFDTFNQKISDSILLNQNISNRKIRVYILWNDDAETSQMSNNEDALSAISDIPALLNVNISFTQVAE